MGFIFVASLPLESERLSDRLGCVILEFLAEPFCIVFGIRIGHQTHAGVF